LQTETVLVRVMFKSKPTNDVASAALKDESHHEN